MIDSEMCLREAEKWAHPQLKSFEVKLGEQRITKDQWQGKSILVESVDGYVDFGLERRELLGGVYAAYPAYTDGCLILGVAIPWRDRCKIRRSRCAIGGSRKACRRSVR